MRAVYLFLTLCLMATVINTKVEAMPFGRADSLPLPQILRRKERSVGDAGGETTTRKQTTPFQLHFEVQVGDEGGETTTRKQTTPFQLHRTTLYELQVGDEGHETSTYKGTVTHMPHSKLFGTTPHYKR